jgi:hypothetical protein
MSQGLNMRAFIGLGFLLAANAADAQTYVTTVNRSTDSVTTTGGGYRPTRTQTSHTSSTSTYTTTITRAGVYRPMGAGGYNPMGQ